MNILNSYLRSKLDFSPVGFLRGDKEYLPLASSAASALHIEAVDRIVFHEKPNADLTLSLKY